jgi:hypothetical protein
MTDEMIALARRAVACKGWKWLPGMRTTDGMRVIHDPHLWPDRPCAIREGTWVDTAVPRPLGDHLPDLTDPATLGCLLALVREAWRCPTVYVRQSTTRRVSDGVIAWEVCDLYLDAEACRALGVPREGSVGSWGHGSEAEALVAALESAP